MPGVEDLSSHLPKTSPEQPVSKQSAHSDLAGCFDAWLREVKPAIEDGGSDNIPLLVIDGCRTGFTFEGSLRIDCHVRGVLPSGDGKLIVGRRGICEADATVRSALIEGTLVGDVVASETIELDGAAQVFGNLQAPRISIGAGAVFQGECHLVVSVPERPSVAPAAAPVQRVAPAFSYECEELALTAAG